MKTYKFKFLAGVFAASTLLISACGQEPYLSGVNSVTYGQAPGGYLPQNPNPPASAAALWGRYVTTITAIDPISGSPMGSQTATITLNAATITGYSGTYVNMSLVSDGTVFGHVEFTSLMNVYQYPMYGGTYRMTYGFASRSSVIQNLSTPPITPYQKPVEIDLVISLANGTTFDPSSSQITILDDGLSQGTGSGTPFTYAVFGALAKQS